MGKPVKDKASTKKVFFYKRHGAPKKGYFVDSSWMFSIAEGYGSNCV